MGRQDEKCLPWELADMAQTRFKCFACGKIYDDEESAIRCHNAPVQPVRKNEKASKPRFLGN
jgi:hypothetical protein